MPEPVERLALNVGNPRENQEIPVGIDFEVSGTVAGTGGAEPHLIDSVTVRLDGEPPVDADLVTVPPFPSVSVKFSATIRLNSPGEHQVTVTATDDIGRSITETVTVSTPGNPHCKPSVPWENYPHTQSLTPYSTCTPESLAGIVAIVREAEGAHKQVHSPFFIET